MRSETDETRGGERQIGYLRALMLAFITVYMLRASFAKPDTVQYVILMLAGWVVWQIAGRVDARMDVVARRIGERIAPLLPSGTRTKR